MIKLYMYVGVVLFFILAGVALHSLMLMAIGIIFALAPLML